MEGTKPLGGMTSRRHPEARRLAAKASKSASARVGLGLELEIRGRRDFYVLLSAAYSWLIDRECSTNNCWINVEV